MKSLVGTLVISLTMMSCNKEGGLFCTQGNGNIVEHTRSTSGFTGVDLQFSGKVYLLNSHTSSVTLKGSSNVLDFIETKVEGNTLVLDIVKGECIKNADDIEIYVSMPLLTKVSIEGSGDIKNLDAIPSNELDIRISGSGNIELADMNPDEFGIRISGSGDVMLSGNETVNYGLIDIIGSGNVKAFGFPTNKMDVDISGSGNSELSVTENLNVDITGSGSVYYKGSPSLNVKITGSGSVQAR